MRKNKIGTMFIISVLALAGIGISYAGFSDSISVYGTVNTATVEIDWIGWYSGTWVYKIWGFDQITPTTPPGTPALYDLDDEILIYRGFTTDQPTETDVSTWATTNGGNAELVAESYAEVYDGEDYDINMVYDQLFPCIDFEADFIFHYAGSIPAKIDVAEILPITEDDGFLTYLWNYDLGETDREFGAWVEAYRAYPIYSQESGKEDVIIEWDINENEPVDVGYQLHNCNYVYVKLVIHLPQKNDLQGLTGTFGGKIGVIQWNDMCTQG